MRFVLAHWKFRIRLPVGYNVMLYYISFNLFFVFQQAYTNFFLSTKTFCTTRLVLGSVVIISY